MDGKHEAGHPKQTKSDGLPNAGNLTVYELTNKPVKRRMSDQSRTDAEQ